MAKKKQRTAKWKFHRIYKRFKKLEECEQAEERDESLIREVFEDLERAYLELEEKHEV